MKAFIGEKPMHVILVFCAFVSLFTFSASFIAPPVAAQDTDTVSVSAVFVAPTPLPTPYNGHKEGYVYYYVPLSDELQDYIQDLLVEYDMPLTLYKYVLGLIQRESEFTKDAVNINEDGSADYGYMQINSENFAWMTETIGVENCTESRNNIRCGVFFLRELYILCDKEIGYALVGYRRGANIGLQYKQIGALDDYAEYIIDYAESLEVRA